MLPITCQVHKRCAKMCHKAALDGSTAFVVIAANQLQQVALGLLFTWLL